MARSFTRSDRLAIVALGSNQGDSTILVRTALARLRALARHPAEFRASSLWRSQPLDCPPGSPEFINAVAVFQPHDEETPESLLAALQGLEREFGRAPKKVRNEPRPLDLDLIAFGRELRTGVQLTLPHPRAAQRRFVLDPLAEVAPDYVFPDACLSVADLIGSLPADPGTVRCSS